MSVAPERFRYIGGCVFILGYYRLGGPGRRRVILLPTSFSRGKEIRTLYWCANTSRKHGPPRSRNRGYYNREFWLPVSCRSASGHPVSPTTQNILRSPYQSLHNDNLRSCRLASRYRSPADITPTPYPQSRTIHRRTIQLAPLFSWSRENWHR